MTEDATMALSELRSLITKAARGAGLSWGLAEEAGWAAEWLARRGMPAADWATAWLAARMDGAVSPVEVGVTLADAPAIMDKALPDGLVAPGYLLPFLHRIAQAGPAVTIASTPGQVARITSSGDVTFGPSWQMQSDGWRLSKAGDADSRSGTAGRPTVSSSVLECLEGLALRTTVPRSDTSRRDAGSTDGDND